jgi:hypothetical protein
MRSKRRFCSSTFSFEPEVQFFESGVASRNNINEASEGNEKGKDSGARETNMQWWLFGGWTRRQIFRYLKVTCTAYTVTLSLKRGGAGEC